MQKLKPRTPILIALLFSVLQLRATPTDDFIHLPDMTVSGGQSADFGVADTSSATKTDTPVIDVPVTVSTVSRSTFDLQGARSLEDVLANVAGVSPSVGDGQRDQVYIRGFAATNDEYIDGVRDSEMYFRDLADIEEVDVIQGPAAALYGRGSSGGLIDRITRKPTDTPVGELDLTWGAWGDERAQLDAGGPLIDGFDYRLDAAAETSGGFRNEYYLQREHLSPSVAWKPAPQTRILVQLDYLKDRRLDDLGIPALVGPAGSGFPGTAPAVPISTFYGSPDGGADHVQAEVGSAAVTIDQGFGAGTSLHEVARAERYTLDRNNVLPTGVYIPGGAAFTGNLDQVWVTRSDRHILRGEKDLFDQLELHHDAEWGRIRNHFLVGTELGAQTANANTTQYADPSVALIDPFLADVPPGEAPSSQTLTAVRAATAGIYVQDQIDLFTQWKALIGLRGDDFDVVQDSALAPYARLQNDSRSLSPRAGLVWQPRPDLSLYASASRSFQPSADGLSVAANTAALAPQETTGFETGLKADLADGRVTATAAAFQEERNISETNPLTQIVSNAGDQRTRGIDLDLRGRLTQRWQLGASYALMDPILVHAGVDSAGVDLDGHLPALVPRNSASVFTTFDIGEGFGLGAWMVYQGGRFSANDDLVSLPAYAVVNLAAYYRSRRWEARINLNNALDHRYILTAGEGTDYTGQTLMPGAPLNATATVTWKF